jgi:hypothetical protein
MTPMKFKPHLDSINAVCNRSKTHCLVVTIIPRHTKRTMAKATYLYDAKLLVPHYCHTKSTCRYHARYACGGNSQLISKWFGSHGVLTSLNLHKLHHSGLGITHSLKSCTKRLGFPLNERDVREVAKLIRAGLIRAHDLVHNDLASIVKSHGAIGVEIVDIGAKT